MNESRKVLGRRDNTETILDLQIPDNKTNEDVNYSIIINIKISIEKMGNLDIRPAVVLGHCYTICVVLLEKAKVVFLDDLYLKKIGIVIRQAEEV